MWKNFKIFILGRPVILFSIKRMRNTKKTKNSDAQGDNSEQTQRENSFKTLKY